MQYIILSIRLDDISPLNVNDLPNNDWSLLKLSLQSKCKHCFESLNIPVKPVCLHAASSYKKNLYCVDDTLY